MECEMWNGVVCLLKCFLTFSTHSEGEDWFHKFRGRWVSFCPNLAHIWCHFIRTWEAKFYWGYSSIIGNSLRNKGKLKGGRKDKLYYISDYWSEGQRMIWLVRGNQRWFLCHNGNGTLKSADSSDDYTNQLSDKISWNYSSHPLKIHVHVNPGEFQLRSVI